MSLRDFIIESDPVLQRVFFDDRRLAPKPGQEALVNIALFEISKLKIEFFRVSSVQFLEAVAWRLRRQYFIARRHSDGYHLEALADVANDGCEHVIGFERAHTDDAFPIDARKRAYYRKRYGRPGEAVRTRTRSRRA